MSQEPRERASYAAHHHFNEAKKLIEEALPRMTKAASFAQTAKLKILQDKSTYAVAVISELVAALDNLPPGPRSAEEMIRKLQDVLEWMQRDE